MNLKPKSQQHAIAKEIGCGLEMLLPEIQKRSGG